MQKTTLSLLSIAAICLVAPACSKKEEKAAEAPPPVQITAVTQDTIRRIVAGDGVLFPLNQENVMPKVSAPVRQFFANRGDHVKAGQMLANLENRDLLATVANNKAQLAQAESNLRAATVATVPEAAVKAQTDVQSDQQQMEAAQKLLESRKQLFDQGALARRQVDEAQVQYASAKAQLEAAQEHLRTFNGGGKQEQIAALQAQVDAAKAQIQSAEAQVSYTQVKAPFNGVIADRPIYPGDMAVAGSPLFTIVDISRVVARVNVPQNQSGFIKLGQTAEIQLPGEDVAAGGPPLQGKVTVVSPATDPNSTTIQVWIEVPNPGEHLKPGASVHAKIITESYKAASVVPARAILPGEEGGTAILVVTSDNIAHKRMVQVGVREGDKLQIVNGARPGEEVVIVGGLGVDDKTKVRVVNTTVEESDDEDNPEPAAPAGDKKAK